MSFFAGELFEFPAAGSKADLFEFPAADEAKDLNPVPELAGAEDDDALLLLVSPLLVLLFKFIFSKILLVFAR